MKESSKTLLRYLAIYQIAGGLLGIVWIFLYPPPQLMIGFVLILGLSTILYITSIVAGIYLWKEKLLIGKRLSMLVQGSQMIFFAIGGLGYLFISGMKLSIDFDFTHSLWIHFGWALSQFNFFFTDSPIVNNSLVGINIVPIIFVYLLEKALHGIEQQKQ